MRFSLGKGWSCLALQEEEIANNFYLNCKTIDFKTEFENLKFSVIEYNELFITIFNFGDKEKKGFKIAKNYAYVTLSR